MKEAPTDNWNITNSMQRQPTKLKKRRVGNNNKPQVRRHGHGKLAMSEASHQPQPIPSDWGDTRLGILTRKKFEMSQMNAKLHLKCILKDMADALHRVRKVRCMNNGKFNLF